MDGSVDHEDLTELIKDSVNARSPEELELALARVIRHPGLGDDGRAEFYCFWEELSDTLLERWPDLRHRRDIVS